MKTNIKIAIVVPAYNADRFLDRCVTSLVSQTYEKLEIFLVNDGSTDTTAELCDEWSAKDKRIHVIHKNNGGLSSARNAGLREVTASYVLFVDSDDWISATAVEKIVQRLSETQADMICFDLYPTDGTRQLSRSIVIPKPFPALQKSNGLGCLHQIHSQNLGNFVWCFLYKTSLFFNKEIFFPEDSLFMEDALFINTLLPHVTAVAYLDEPLYFYYQNSSGSLTTTHNIRHARSGFNSITKVSALEVSKDDQTHFLNYLIDLFFFVDLVAGPTKSTSDPNLRREIRATILRVSEQLKFSQLNVENTIKIILLKIGLYDAVVLLKQLIRRLVSK